jgi:hypothetical protein
LKLIWFKFQSKKLFFFLAESMISTFFGRGAFAVLGGMIYGKGSSLVSWDLRKIEDLLLFSPWYPSCLERDLFWFFLLLEAPEPSRSSG